MGKPDYMVLKKLGYRKKMFEDYQRSIKIPAGLKRSKSRQVKQGEGDKGTVLLSH